MDKDYLIGICTDILQCSYNDLEILRRCAYCQDYIFDECKEKHHGEITMENIIVTIFEIEIYYLYSYIQDMKVKYSKNLTENGIEFDALSKLNPLRDFVVDIEYNGELIDSKFYCIKNFDIYSKFVGLEQFRENTGFEILNKEV